ncbi:MAG: hypothetical protein P9M12_01260 [Candidatus Aceula lacicola]|nr:hypothetical protein [Candidatus Aceula lacicola]
MKRIYLRNLFLSFILLVLCLVNLARVYAEESPTFINYYEKALEVFPGDPRQGTELAMKARLYATYDITRVADKTSHQAWLTVNKNFIPIYRWAAYHPKIYKEIVVDAVSWAKRNPPPDYYPSWMINHGMSVLTEAMTGDNVSSLFNSDHDPEVDWQESIGFLEKLVNDKNFWLELENNLEPGNALKILKAQNEKIIHQYDGTVNDEEMQFLKEKLNSFLADFDSNNAGDTMVSVAEKIDELVIKQMETGSFTGKVSFEKSQNMTKATLRTLSSAFENYADSNKNIYPIEIEELNLRFEVCDQIILGYVYDCQLSEEGYEVTATPEFSDGMGIIRLKTGGVLDY